MRIVHRVLVLVPGVVTACSHPQGDATPSAKPPVIDRFSAAAGHLMVRDSAHPLPSPDQPIDLDHPPFITQGLAADGAIVRYYNFDVQSAEPATLYRLTHVGKHEAIADQLDIVDVLPGDHGYSDFWRVAWVEVPDTYASNTSTNAAELRARGLSVALSATIIDCPIVPRGTTAHEATGVEPAAPVELWYRGYRVSCLRFGEPLVIDNDDRVPTSPIYVTFAKPGAFRAVGTTRQTHNVVMSVPGDVAYSPLWAVHIYDPSAFDTVIDGATALAAPIVNANGPLVNCPIAAVIAR
jgi:hypothetical protein